MSSDLSRTEKKQVILDNCITVFVKNGLENTGMRDLAAGSVMNVSSFYKYFESKEAIIEECVKKCIDNIEKRIKAEYNNITPDFKNEIRRYFMLLSEEKHILRFIYQAALTENPGKKLRYELEIKYMSYFEYAEKLAISYGVEKSKFMTAFCIFLSAVYDYCFFECTGISCRKIECIYSVLDI